MHKIPPDLGVRLLKLRTKGDLEPAGVSLYLKLARGIMNKVGAAFDMQAHLGVLCLARQKRETVMKPHTRAWYARLAAETGVYDYPWTQVLSAPGGETLFDTLLENLLTPETHVLEAGCGHGRDAQKLAGRVQSYTGYDFTPAYVARARENVPEAEFVLWDSSREPVPESFRGRFNLVISRRGPTSVVSHLLELCAPGARVLCVHPEDGSIEARVRKRLAEVGLVPDAQWQVCVNGFLPTVKDFVLYRRFHGDERPLEVLYAEWNEGAGDQGFPLEERRYIWSVSYAVDEYDVKLPLE